MTWSPDRVVAIAKAVEGGYQLIGSGAVVADQRVLTALHVVKDHASVDEETRMTTPRLFARRDGSREFIPLGKALWRGDEHLDVAVFEWESARVVQPHPCSTLFAQDLAEGTPWSARGYPMLDPKTPSASLARFGGALLRHFAGHDKELELPVGAVPHEFFGYQGLSGAVVLDNLDRVVGVVKAVTNPSVWDGKKLSAVPVSLLVQNEHFLTALGVKPSSERLEKRLDAVIAEVEHLFEGRAAIAEAISLELGLAASGGLHELVGRLVREVSAVSFVRAVNQIHAATIDRHARRVLEALFWKALRYAADWRAELSQHIDRFENPASPEPVRLSLRCWSRSVATVVLAGVDDCDVTFLSEAASDSTSRPELRGAGFLNVPASQIAPILGREGATATRAIVQHLAREIAHPYFRDFIDSPEPGDFDHLCQHVAHSLYARTYHPARPEERAPRYLVVNQKDLRKHGPEAFEVLAKAVHKVLPSLRIVLLEGVGLPTFNAEDDLDQAIVSMNRNRTS